MAPITPWDRPMKNLNRHQLVGTTDYKLWQMDFDRYVIAVDDEELHSHQTRAAADDQFEAMVRVAIRKHRKIEEMKARLDYQTNNPAWGLF